MSLTNVPHSDSEVDDANDDSANQPLLQSSFSTPKSTKTTTITVKLPNSTNQTKSDNKHRILSKISHLATNKRNRNDYRRGLNRDRWNRINFGILIISFLSVVYFCVTINLNVDKPSPQQIVVDVPSLDTNLLGQKGNI